MNGWTILRREARSTIVRPASEDRVLYTVVERGIEMHPDTYAEASRWYANMYAHDDRDGTEIIYIDADGRAYVDRITRPQPAVDMQTVEVKG